MHLTGRNKLQLVQVDMKTKKLVRLQRFIGDVKYLVFVCCELICAVTYFIIYNGVNEYICLKLVQNVDFLMLRSFH